METAHILRTLWRRKLWVAAGLCIAVAAAWAATFKITFPPSLESPSIEFGSASTQVLLDTERSSPLVDLGSEIDPLATRAQVYTRLVESDPARAAITAAAGYRPAEVLITGRTSLESFTRAASEPAAEQRATELAGEGHVKRLLFAADPGLPVISIFAQAPTPTEAVRLADGAAEGLIDYVGTIESTTTPPETRVVLRQLGPAHGSWVNEGASRSLALMVFFGVFAVWCLLVLFGSNVVAALRKPDAPQQACLNCGGELPADARFCLQCGTPTAALAGPAGNPVASADDARKSKNLAADGAPRATLVRRRTAKAVRSS